MRAVLISLILVVLAAGISWRRQMMLEKDLGIAAARAVVQLLVIAAVINLVLAEVGAAGALLVIMLVAAAWTSGRRLKGVPASFWRAGVAIFAGASVALVVLFGLGAFRLEPRFLIPIAGMLIGNCMTATSLAGTRLRDDIVAQRLEIDARLALGVRAGHALVSYRRRAATGALIPTVDATKNVGLIFLPGAFVGMILAGASPMEAARVQLVVLFMLLGAVGISGVVSTIVVARAFMGAGERIVLPPELE